VDRGALDSDYRDAELIRRAQAGAVEAFAELVARYQDRLYNVCYRLCHDRATALDLTQTAFLRALEALPRFGGRARFYTWLYRIAVNLAVSERRRRREVLTGWQAEEGKTFQPAGAEGREASQRLEERELQAQVQAALDALEPEFRAAVVLRDIEGLDYRQIAEILGVPVGTVKSRIFRARSTLRRFLNKSEQQERAGGA
jgi:RNA polymerase sigma-70 factor (ECF subfamily)